MCGRASLTKQEKELEERFKATFYQEDIARYNPLPSYNVAPTQLHPIIADNAPAQLQLFRWGLIPFWAKDEKIGSKMINARAETVVEKPAFRQALLHRRCLVPFDGFYEWMKLSGGKKQPYRITLVDNDIFSVAGLWEEWQSPSGEPIHSFTVLTIPPNDYMAKIHNRMPAILNLENERLWLDQEINPKELIALLTPYPSEMMVAVPVSIRVNKASENDPGLIVPIGPALRHGETIDLFNS
jgi:putative SOS response-associated peptidase YedK